MARSSKSILIASADAGERTRLRGTLQFEGYSPTEAHSGTDVLSSLATGTPALLLLDLGLEPGLIEKVMALPLEQQPTMIPIVDRASRPAAIEAVRCCAADFLERPWKDADLLLSIKSALTGPQPNRAAIPASGEELLAAIRRDLSKRHYDHARRIFEESSDTVGGEAAYFNLLGVLAEAEGNAQGARAFYRKAAVWAGPFASAAKSNLARLDEIDARGHSVKAIRLGDEDDTTVTTGKRPGLLARLLG